MVEGMKEIVQLMEEWQLTGKDVSSANTTGARAMARAMVVGPRVVGYPGG